MGALRECLAAAEGDLVRGNQNVARSTTVVGGHGERNGLLHGGELAKTPGMQRLRERMWRFFPKVCANLGGRLLHAHHRDKFLLSTRPVWVKSEMNEHVFFFIGSFVFLSAMLLVAPSGH